MGAEIVCTARFGEKTAKGKARLEADTLQFSGPDVRVSIRFKHIAKVTARVGVLAVESSHGRLSKLRASLKSNGALWVIRPKGRPEISERAVMAAGKAAGLVDVKVVSYSPTHTAEKFVIPVKARLLPSGRRRPTRRAR